MKNTLILATTALLWQCQSATVNTNTDYKPLSEDLNAKKEAFNAKASEEKKQAYADGLDFVVEQGILEKAKNIGDKAPAFSLSNAQRKEIALNALLEKGPVILVWYRGGWCPYCNITLHRLQEELPNFEAHGAQLVALTPELPDSSLSTAEKHDLSFEVLTDLHNEVAKDYGVVFSLTPEVAKIYQASFRLHAYNGDESNELPLAATYVIDTDGTITYAFLDADYRNRAEPSDIIAALEKLEQKN